MTDTFTPEKRSNIMSHIRGRETFIEVDLRKELYHRGYRYRKNVTSLPGIPDIALPKYDTVIRVQGCFWHRHGCKLSSMPKSNVDYWEKKFATNVENDPKTQRALELLGWRVITVWECEIKKDVSAVADQIEEILKGKSSEEN